MPDMPVHNPLGHYTPQDPATLRCRRQVRQHRLCFMVHLIGSVRQESGVPCSFCEFAV